MNGIDYQKNFVNILFLSAIMLVREFVQARALLEKQHAHSLRCEHVLLTPPLDVSGYFTRYTSRSTDSIISRTGQRSMLANSGASSSSMRATLRSAAIAVVWLLAP